ncbi:MAG: LPP20 family lipoprotein [Treponema sp.]|nr:LPP20 family lipoprotein [Treponema sp.]
MKKLFISLILLLLHFALCFSMAPNWLVNPEKEFPTEKYIRAAGEGNSETSAKQAALAELSSHFSATIKSKTYAHSSKSQRVF